MKKSTFKLTFLLLFSWTILFSQDQSVPEHNIYYDVPLVPQQTNMSCWAAGAAMITGWRDKVSVDPKEVADGVGYWNQYQHNSPGLDPNDVKMLDKYALTRKAPQSYTVDGFAQVLENGPLWVASAEPGAHIRVVTGMMGDGTPEGTIVYVNDPWDKDKKELDGMSEADFAKNNKGSQYSESYIEFMNKMENLARRELNEPAPVYIAHP